MENLNNKHFAVRLEARLKNSILVEARQKLGLTIRAAAENIGITEIFLGDIERFKCYPDPNTMRKICNYYREQGIFMFEEDVFPEELIHVSKNISKKYITKRELSKAELISLDEIGTKSLPQTEISIDKITDDEYIKKNINNTIKLLMPRDAAIIKMRFGLETGEEMSYSEIGRRMCLSQSRVGQIFQRAIERLKGISIRKKLVE